MVQIFISCRFSEALEQARMLQDALISEGMSCFLCDVQVGDSIGDAVRTNLVAAELVVILGTSTYGKNTGSSFSTLHELEFIVNEQKPFFLIKMCDRFEEDIARFHLTAAIVHFPWPPEQQRVLPPDLVPQIIRKLRGSAGTPPVPRQETPPHDEGRVCGECVCGVCVCCNKGDQESTDMSSFLSLVQNLDEQKPFRVILRASGDGGWVRILFVLTQGQPEREIVRGVPHKAFHHFQAQLAKYGYHRIGADEIKWTPTPGSQFPTPKHITARSHHGIETWDYIQTSCVCCDRGDATSTDTTHLQHLIQQVDTQNPFQVRFRASTDGGWVQVLFTLRKGSDETPMLNPVAHKTFHMLQMHLCKAGYRRSEIGTIGWTPKPGSQWPTPSHITARSHNGVETWQIQKD